MRNETVIEAIRESIDELNALPFDYDLKMSLPMRPDVKIWAYNVMCGVVQGRRNYDRLMPPAVILEADGTLSVHFYEANAALYLRFPCHGTIVYEMHFPDDCTQVNGEIKQDEDFEFDKNKLDSCIDWIRTFSFRKSDRT